MTALPPQSLCHAKAQHNDGSPTLQRRGAFGEEAFAE